MFSIIAIVKHICLTIRIEKEDIHMSNTTFMNVDEVAEVLGTSVAFGYKVIKQFNNELKAKGYFTVAGKVNRQYF